MLESDYAKYLDLLKKAKEVRSWEYESGKCKFDLKVRGKRICIYTIDFRVVYTCGRVEYVEVKNDYMARTNYSFKLRWKLVKALRDDLIEQDAVLKVVTNKDF